MFLRITCPMFNYKLVFRDFIPRLDLDLEISRSRSRSR